MVKTQQTKTLVQVQFNTWKELQNEKLVAGETFDDVIKRLLHFYRSREWEA